MPRTGAKGVASAAWQMSLMMIFVGPSLMHTEKQKV
jgi:hypothetical protein